MISILSPIDAETGCYITYDHFYFIYVKTPFSNVKHRGTLHTLGWRFRRWDQPRRHDRPEGSVVIVVIDLDSWLTVTLGFEIRECSLSVPGSTHLRNGADTNTNIMTGSPMLELLEMPQT